MIEVDGVAIPLEPGKHYLLVFERGKVRHADVAMLLTALRAEWGVEIFALEVNGDPRACVRLIEAERPE